MIQGKMPLTATGGIFHKRGSDICNVFTLKIIHFTHSS
ncbi:hypothetical protein ABH13_1854 [Bacillus velezensis]|nr:hypothetical protein V529_17850 [Bacillus velezensis SQR9]AKL76438.1 hypothetical protein ABH13_1854 [Bacillus velezensis]RAP22312.1 hypothetical protein C2W63_01015 [Bacillus velezensis]